MNDYELTILLRPDLAQKELDKEVKGVADLLEKIGAKVSKKTEPAKKSLAYEIKKCSEAFYTYFELNLAPSEVSGLEQKLKLQENILRYLIVKKDVR